MPLGKLRRQRFGCGESAGVGCRRVYRRIRFRFLRRRGGYIVLGYLEVGYVVALFSEKSNDSAYGHTLGSVGSLI